MQWPPPQIYNLGNCVFDYSDDSDNVNYFQLNTPLAENLVQDFKKSYYNFVTGVLAVPDNNDTNVYFGCFVCTDHLGGYVTFWNGFCWDYNKISSPFAIMVTISEDNPNQIAQICQKWLM